VLKNKHQAVSHASSFQPIACEHLQKPYNVGPQPQAQFFNI